MSLLKEFISRKMHIKNKLGKPSYNRKKMLFNKMIDYNFLYM